MARYLTAQTLYSTDFHHCGNSYFPHIWKIYFTSNLVNFTGGSRTGYFAYCARYQIMRKKSRDTSNIHFYACMYIHTNVKREGQTVKYDKKIMCLSFGERFPVEESKQSVQTGYKLCEPIKTCDTPLSLWGWQYNPLVYYTQAVRTSIC